MTKRSVKYRDKRLKNLKPWKPGQSGNPRGRPIKDVCFTSLLKDELSEINPEDKQKRSWARLIVLATMKLAIKGNATALKEVWDRIDGRIPDKPQREHEDIKVIVNGCNLDRILAQNEVL